MNNITIMENIQSLKEMHEIIENELFPLFYLSRPSCGVCLALKPRIIELADSYEKMTSYYVNLDENEEIAGQFSIFTIPGILIFAQGKEVIREARNFSVDQLYERLDRLSSLMG